MSFDPNPNNPLKAILIEPKYLLYLLIPENLSSLSYSINVCLKPT